jgi:hypothetical protein
MSEIPLTLSGIPLTRSGIPLTQSGISHTKSEDRHILTYMLITGYRMTVHGIKTTTLTTRLHPRPPQHGH